MATQFVQYPQPTLNSGPVSFTRDGSAQAVIEDTTTPANSRPLPVKVLNGSGAVPDWATEATLAGLSAKFGSLGQKAMAGSAPVVIASDQSAIPVSGPLTDVQLRASAVPVSAVSLPLPTGAATETTLDAVSTKLTDGTQKTQIVDAAGDIVDVKLLSTGLSGTDKGIVTNTVIHGETTGGGGGYVDVKVTPSGALVTESTISGLDAAVLGQQTMAASLPVVIASNQSAVPVSGPLTDTQLRATAVPVSGPLTDSQLRATAVPVSGPLTDTQLRASAVPVSGPLTDVQLRASAVPVSAASLPLPAGAATETTLSALNTKTPALGQAAMASSSPVVIASNQTAIPTTTAGRSIVTRARNVYSSTNVTTGAYVQLVASLAAAVNEVEIFDSSGQTLVLATGGAGSEVDQAFVFPGGNGRIPLAIASATRVSIKAVSATANDGEIAINFYS